MLSTSPVSHFRRKSWDKTWHTVTVTWCHHVTFCHDVRHLTYCKSGFSVVEAIVFVNVNNRACYPRSRSDNVRWDERGYLLGFTDPLHLLWQPSFQTKEHTFSGSRLVAWLGVPLERRQQCRAFRMLWVYLKRSRLVEEMARPVECATKVPLYIAC